MLDHLVRVICYHQILGIGKKAWSGHTCTPERLEKHITYLWNRGWRIMTFKEYLERLAQGRIKSGYKIAILTFDDGYKDNLVAAQILDRFGVHGVFGIITCTLSGILPPSLKRKLLENKIGINVPPPLVPLITRLLRWDAAKEELQLAFGYDFETRACMELFLRCGELLRLHNGGHEIASHTVDHLSLPQLLPSRAYLELAESKRFIEGILDTNCATIIFPYGEFNDEVLEQAAQVGYGVGVGYEDKAMVEKSTLAFLGLRRIDEKRLEEVITTFS